MVGPLSDPHLPHRDLADLWSARDVSGIYQRITLDRFVDRRGCCGNCGRGVSKARRRGYRPADRSTGSGCPDWARSGYFPHSSDYCSSDHVADLGFHPDSRIGMIDRLLGLVFGIVRGFILVVIPFNVYEFVYPKPEQQQAFVAQSKSLPYLRSTGEVLRSTLVRIIPRSLTEPKEEPRQGQLEKRTRVVITATISARAASS